jgi:cytosine/adenosine deaminase-related metal-dependent hydrolase
VASNDRMHLLEEARQAALLHAARSGHPDSLSALEALSLATWGGARALRLDHVIGTLEVGKQADLAAFPLATSLGEVVYDPAVALVHVQGGQAQATLVTVAGRELVRDGVVTAADPAWFARLRVTGDRLGEWRRAQLA